MAKYILFDPSKDYFEILKLAFQDDGHELLMGDTIDGVKHKLVKERPLGLIVNMQSQDPRGIDFIKICQTEFPGTKIVVTFNDTLPIRDKGYNVEDLKNLGVVDVLIKPFHPSKLIKCLMDNEGANLVMKSELMEATKSDSIEMTAKAAEMSSVEIDNFLPDQNVMFNVYIKGEEENYIRILTTGRKFTKEELSKLKNEKKVTHLYFTKKDQNLYLAFCNQISDKILKSKLIPDGVKVNFAKSMVEKYVENVYTSGIDSLSVESGKAICNKVFGMVNKGSELINQLNALQAIEPSFFSHCFVVTFIVNIIAREFAWESALTLETLGLACMLHDIGKSKLPKSAAFKRPFEMNKAELQEYYKHPIYGAEILSMQRIINPTVAKIVLQHHEVINGSGFPYELKGEGILIFSRVLFFADQLAHLMVDKKIGAPEAMKLLFSDPETPHIFDKDVIKNFLQAFKNDSAKDAI